MARRELRVLYGDYAYYKMFGGKPYRLYGDFTSKIEARRHAERHRKSGKNARVISRGSDGSWSVYTR